MILAVTINMYLSSMFLFVIDVFILGKNLLKSNTNFFELLQNLELILLFLNEYAHYWMTTIFIQIFGCK
jgi:hypothetical protein